MSVVRAVIAQAFPFSRSAILRTEDGRTLALTQRAKGFQDVVLREGLWLSCELASEHGALTAVRPCDEPSDVPASPGSKSEDMRESRMRELETALRSTAPTIHMSRPVHEVPVVRLASWQISELMECARHAWGYDTDAREGRCSTVLAEFDPSTASLRSATGRRYELTGPPGIDSDGEYVWHAWLSVHGLVAAHARSVTEEVWRAIQTGGLER